MSDSYAILGLQRGASPDEVLQAYRREAVRWHPENPINAGKEKEAGTKFMAIAQAYDELTNTEPPPKPTGLFKAFKKVKKEVIDPHHVFGHVFETAIREILQKKKEEEGGSPGWIPLGAAAGAVLGFLLGGPPGAAVGAAVGTGAGAVRYQRGMSVAEAFMELPPKLRKEVLIELGKIVVTVASTGVL